MRLVVCADFGSTFTKTMLVSLDDAAVVASAEHPTTTGTTGADVMDGFAACRDALCRTEKAAATADVLACSSAGGGLRIGVVGNEALVTAEAGRRVALSSGGRVVHVGADGLDADRLAALRAAEPDVVLLVGGTDGGNAEVLVQAAATLADARWDGPVVVAGNADAAAEVSARLGERAVPHEVAANVVPRIGVLAPQEARAAIRAVFLRHVIGGKHLSKSAAFADLVVGPTPDVVLAGVEAFAEQAGDVAVVDVGGATTDVHSVVDLDPEDAPLARQVIAPTRTNRSVEGDLGMRWSAPYTVAHGIEAGLVEPGEHDALRAAAERRRAVPALVPDDTAAYAADHRLAEVAVGVALRLHAGSQRVRPGSDGRVVERTGTDLREVRVLVGSGGVLRHAPDAVAHRLLRGGTGADVPGGWLLPRAPRTAVDRAYVLVAAGLLAAEHPAAAAALLHRHLRVR